MKNNIKDIVDKLEKYSNFNIIVQTEIEKYYINIEKYSFLHLMGLHYTNKFPNKVRGREIDRLIHNENNDNNVILNKIKKYNPEMLKSVISRLETLDKFLFNLEKGFVVENTNANPESNLKSKYFIIELENNKILQLGLATRTLNTYYLETYLVRNNENHFKDSEIKEKIIGIYREIDEEIEIPFSFDEEKNLELIRVFNDRDQEFNYQKIIKDYENYNQKEKI